MRNKEESHTDKWCIREDFIIIITTTTVIITQEYSERKKIEEHRYKKSDVQNGWTDFYSLSNVVTKYIHKYNHTFIKT